MPPNTTGVIPEYLTNESAQLGRAVKASFAPETAVARMTDLTVGCGPDNTTNNLVVLWPPVHSTLEFDAIILEEDLAKGNQRVSGYQIEACHAVAGCSEADWVTITAAGRAGIQTVSLGQTIGRRVIERGFNATNGQTLSVKALRFRCTAAFPAEKRTAFLKSFSAHKMQPPPGWPKPKPPPFDCHAFNCTCHGMADYYGALPPTNHSARGLHKSTEEYRPVPAFFWTVLHL